MRRFFTILSLLLCCSVAFAQADRHDVRAGNRKFRKGDFAASEIDYRKAVLKDSTSLHAQYNLASALYREQDYDGASQALGKIAKTADDADAWYNSGDAAVQKQDWAGAVKAFRESLLRNPGDLDAKENYIYAKKKLEDQQNQGGGGQNDQDQQNQDQDNQDQNRDNQQQQQPQEQKISEQQAQQMLKAMQAKEKDTQDKVNKEKAALLKSRQKEKNW